MKPKGIFQFGEFQVDVLARSLQREEKIVTLSGRAFDVLLYLVQNPGKVLSRDELVKNVWPDTFVDENSLAQSISALRRALDEKPGDNTYIVTLPGRGYQFVSPVKAVAPESLGAVPDVENDASNASGGLLLRQHTILTTVIKEKKVHRSSPVSRTQALLASAGILMVALVVSFGVVRHRRGPPPEPTERQLTANPYEDWVASAAISADGKYLAYNDQTGLYVRSVDTGETHPVTVPAELANRIRSLCWFPGGGKLLADVAGSDGVDIWVITILGEAEPYLLYRNGYEPAISPDGRMVVFTSGKNFKFGQTQQEVWVGVVNGEAAQKLVEAGQFESIYSPAWSPDSRWIAYARRWKTAQGGWSSAVEVRPASGGPAKTLVSESSLPKPHTVDMDDFYESWSPDWRLVFSVAEDSAIWPSRTRYSLWAVRAQPNIAESGGKPERVTQWTKSWPRNLSITADGKRLSLVNMLVWNDVYVGELGPGGTTMKAPRRLTLDDRGSDLAIWTRDGQAILFSSTRNGRVEIFRQRLHDGSAEMVVAGSKDAQDVGVSPDGIWLLYEESESTPVAGGSASGSVWVMRRAVGGGPQETILELPRDKLSDFQCSSNPKASSPCVLGLLEGKDIVFDSLDPARGPGKRLGKIEVTSAWMGWGLSPDASRLALVDDDKYEGRIEVLTLMDGAWHEVSLKPGGEHLQSVTWAADGKGFFVTSCSANSYDLLHVTLSGEVQPLLRNGRSKWLYGPHPSPDGKYLAFEAQTFDSNVWMIDNF